MKRSFKDYLKRNTGINILWALGISIIAVPIQYHRGGSMVVPLVFAGLALLYTIISWIDWRRG